MTRPLFLHPLRAARIAAGIGLCCIRLAGLGLEDVPYWVLGLPAWFPTGLAVAAITLAGIGAAIQGIGQLLANLAEQLDGRDALGAMVAVKRRQDADDRAALRKSQGWPPSND